MYGQSIRTKEEPCSLSKLGSLGPSELACFLLLSFNGWRKFVNVLIRLLPTGIHNRDKDRNFYRDLCPRVSCIYQECCFGWLSYIQFLIAKYSFCIVVKRMSKSTGTVCFSTGNYFSVRFFRLE